jgi:hypothetical protein
VSAGGDEDEDEHERKRRDIPSKTKRHRSLLSIDPESITARCRAMRDDPPAEAARLLSVAPAKFVSERERLVRELREAGRSEDAALVASLRKPPPVVLAVNRAARARPKAARAAANAAVRVKKTQVGGDPDAYRSALAELEDSLALLSDVALAHVAPEGKEPSEAMRRRVRDLLRNAVADDDAREALAGGVLEREVETAGFGSFAGVAPARGAQKRAAPSKGEREERAAEHRREREHELRAELAVAEKHLQEAERSLREAEGEQARAEQAVAAIRAKLERL